MPLTCRTECMQPRWEFSLSPLTILFLSALLLAPLALAEGQYLQLGEGVTEAGLLGQRLQYLKESGKPLHWQGALAALQRGDFKPSEHDTLSFGVGVNPVWVTLAIHNSTAVPSRRVLLIDTPWIDQIEVYLVADGRLLEGEVTGDLYPDSQAGQGVPGFRVPLVIPAGDSRLLVRLNTADPLVAPLYLLNEPALEHFTLQRLFTYGLSYGYLLALIFYNATLAIGIRDRRHLLYALYLGIFALTNISYTGFGAVWIWGDDVSWQRWATPVLMWCFGVGGLIFSASFLRIRRHWPGGQRLGVLAAAVPGILILLAIQIDHKALALFSALAFMMMFNGLMLLLGVVSVRRNIPTARFFLAAIAAGATGTMITTLAIWGMLPISEVLFRAAEGGMLLEATLLALALAARLRQVHAERARAEVDANTDALTQLNNRRALNRYSASLWAQRYPQQALSLVVLDIDHFKQLNDRYGHACGDDVLRHIGRIIARSIRGQDVAARWGGEEFTILLDQCNLESGIQFADRLRSEIARMAITADGDELHVTASFGVAQARLQDESLDALIARADRALYQAKHEGRNRVCVAPGLAPDSAVR